MMIFGMEILVFISEKFSFLINITKSISCYKKNNQTEINNYNDISYGNFNVYKQKVFIFDKYYKVN